jgi:hypothetical protein
MQASLDLADQGFKVYLIEKQSAIGGKMAQLDKTFPTNDCAMCTISPKLVETGRHPNIQLMRSLDCKLISLSALSIWRTSRMIITKVMFVNVDVRELFRIDHPHDCFGRAMCGIQCV